MNSEKEFGKKGVPVDGRLQKIMGELEELDKDFIDADGVLLKPSQCYYLEMNPFHILYNTNCPDSLKKRIETIVSLYMPG